MGLSLAPKQYKYVGVLFISDGGMEWEMNTVLYVVSVFCGEDSVTLLAFYVPTLMGRNHNQIIKILDAIELAS